MMKYTCTLIAVKDVHKSLAFYQKWFGVEVQVDLGWNIGLKGGLALQEHYPELVNFPPETLIEKSHNMELYFETDDFAAFDEALQADASIEWVHHTVTYSWKQRVLRIYDLDHHIIEVGESMASIFKRYLAEGKTIEETAQLTEHPVEYVRAVAEGKVQ